MWLMSTTDSSLNPLETFFKLPVRYWNIFLKIIFSHIVCILDIYFNSVLHVPHLSLTTISFWFEKLYSGVMHNAHFNQTLHLDKRNSSQKLLERIDCRVLCIWQKNDTLTRIFIYTSKKYSSFANLANIKL